MPPKASRSNGELIFDALIILVVVFLFMLWFGELMMILGGTA